MSDFVKSGICGVIVGDALGVPFEFKSRYELERNPVTDMVGHGTYNVPKGTWSDDSSMTLALLNSIVSTGCIDYDSIMNEFCEWMFHQKYNNSDMGTFDYGGTTFNALYNYQMGVNPLECGGSNEDLNNSNGCLMRILPLAFIPNLSYEVIEDVCSLTHNTMRCKIACVLYVEIARQIICNHKMGFGYTFCDCVSVASDLIKEYYDGVDDLKFFNRIFDSDYSGGVESRGYVVSTLECAIWGVKYGEDFRSSLLSVVNLGGDTDTVGAVCGGLAGLYYGFDEIPSDWVWSVNRMSEVLELCDVLEDL